MRAQKNLIGLDPNAHNVRIDEILKIVREANETLRRAIVHSWLSSLDQALHANLDTASRRLMGVHLGVLLRDYPLDDLVAERVPGLLIAARMAFEDGAVRLANSFSDCALELARAHHDPALTRRAANTAGILAAKQRDFTLALRRFEEAHTIASEQRDEQSSLQIQLNIATCLQDSGRYGQAIQTHRRVCRATDGKHDSFSTLHALLARINLVFCTLALGDISRALTIAAEADDLLPHVSIDSIARHQFELAYVTALLKTNDVITAQQRVERLSQERPDHEDNTQLLFDLMRSLCDVYSDRVDIGLTRLRRVTDQAKQGVTFYEDALRALAQAYEVAGDHRQALETIQTLADHHRAAQIKRLERQQAALQEDLLGELDPQTSALVLLDGHAADLRVRTFQDELARRELSLLESWAIATSLIDDDTGAHCFRVGCMSEALARACGVSATVARTLGIAARLHDVGKVGIPHNVLLKPGRLTQNEWMVLQTHPVIGEELLARSSHPALHIAARIARSHHEWWDGSGYPDRLRGVDIPLEARIVSVVDAYDVMTSGRVYRRASSREEAIAELTFMAGRQFDPTIVEAFLQLLSNRLTVDQLEQESRRQAEQSSALIRPHPQQVRHGFA
ncbi:MAG TPA: HD domain-containing phosphohydrolase [Burkholderiaceae bacterium]|nr:HD domain-containing phosphohydrolase [Burkholderiaceae bacterium]